MSKRKNTGSGTNPSLSAVWEFFKVDSSEQAVAVCQLCRKRIPWGAAGSKTRSYGTTALWGHLEAAHHEQFDTGK